MSERDAPAAMPPASEFVRVRRAQHRGRYDLTTIHAILDAGVVCHIGHVVDGAPCVTPTLYWREGNRVYWHGSAASRMMRLSAGAAVCLTVTHLDGLVLARSAFHHSANYRSVMIFGTAEKVEGEAAKERHLERFIEDIWPGRWSELRPMTQNEVKGVTLLSLPIDEASAKVRSGPPVDDEADYAQTVWAGEVPLHRFWGPSVRDPRLPATVPTPGYLANPQSGLRS